ncbi:carbohydrate-binding family 9-like protein [Aureibaculum sp. 2210JD6-5]|uniref:carbohydrate-binding family 9-like protein n=1 Tax=Aureibaculum sp. 2210JD6-5 TaxID=3103957 RepID=UPI002AACDFA4|nr:carbohydrate-binding family 9-like protein [Aureibaculum sp. 2210JD6-5]MDY7395583.1 carbohydrate-binding family 9-like protein [Aureibaculum sp. 2210JD6-5]
MNKLQFKIFTLFVFIGILTSCAQTEQLVPRTHIAYKTNDKMSIDGLANEKVWENVPWSENFIDIEGIKKPTYKTNVKMLWDEEYYYIFAKIEEPHVWANLKQRDTIIFYNNDFEVFVDPDGDTHNYFEIELNALNTVWELFVTKPYREQHQPVLNDWNITGLKTAVQIDGTLNNPNDTDKGWTVEIAIPWKTFRKSYFEDNVPRDDFWRVNFSRVNWDFDLIENRYYRKKDKKGDFLHEYNWVWSPMGVINMHEPEKWGYVYFSTKKAGEKDEFTIPADEHIKWKLAELYRAQKSYYSKNGKWANSLESLDFSSFTVNNENIEFAIDIHLTGYNISAKSPFSDKTIIIKEDGKIIVKD